MNPAADGSSVYPCMILHGAGMRVSRGDDPKSIVLTAESLDVATVALSPADACDFAHEVFMGACALDTTQAGRAMPGYDYERIDSIVARIRAALGRDT